MSLAPQSVQQAIGHALAVLDCNRRQFDAWLPDDTTRGQFYLRRDWGPGWPPGGNYGWTTGFFPGLLWLAGDLRPAGDYAEQALGWLPSFARRLEERVDVDNHDLGFVYSLSCVAAYRRTGSPLARQIALEAAGLLLGRFRQPPGVIQAWGTLDDPAEAGRAIIDSLMNLPLLFWAAQAGGRPRFAQAARCHALRLRDHILRPDGSTYHTFFFDPQTGDPRFGRTAQGAGDDSCWARGQAWAIYGFALAYRCTAEPAFAQAAHRAAGYFLAHLPPGRVPYWDLTFSPADRQERDSSAATIACCGLLELGGPYRPAAEDLLQVLLSEYAVHDPSESTALLRHAVYSKPHGKGVDEGCLWGDYFYLEALARFALPGWVPFW